MAEVEPELVPLSKNLPQVEEVVRLQNKCNIFLKKNAMGSKLKRYITEDSGRSRISWRRVCQSGGEIHCLTKGGSTHPSHLNLDQPLEDIDTFINLMKTTFRMSFWFWGLTLHWSLWILFFRWYTPHGWFLFST